MRETHRRGEGWGGERGGPGVVECDCDSVLSELRRRVAVHFLPSQRQFHACLSNPTVKT